MIERNQNANETKNQKNRAPPDISFGNDRGLKFLIEPTNILSAEDEVEQPRTLEDLPAKKDSPIKPAVDFFKIKNDATILPDKHAKEETLQIRVPHSILKDSSNTDYDSLGSVFQSELNTNRADTNRKKKVEFQEQSDYFSVYDSQRNLKQSSRSNNLSLAGSSALQDSQIKHSRDINKFLKQPNINLTTLEDSLMASAYNQLQDKMLNEFPIFPFNEDYLKAIALIV